MHKMTVADVQFSFNEKEKLIHQKETFTKNSRNKTSLNEEVKSNLL